MYVLLEASRMTIVVPIHLYCNLDIFPTVTGTLKENLLITFAGSIFLTQRTACVLQGDLYKVHCFLGEMLAKSEAQCCAVQQHGRQYIIYTGIFLVGNIM